MVINAFGGNLDNHLMVYLAKTVQFYIAIPLGWNR